MSTYSSNYSGYNIYFLKKWPNIKDEVDIWIKWCLVNIKQGLDRAVMCRNNSGSQRPLQAFVVMRNLH